MRRPICFYGHSVLCVVIMLIILPIQPGFCKASIDEKLLEEEAEGLTNKSAPKVFLSIINDNNTGNVDRGEKGYYLGPDDYLTVSAFLRVHYQEWRAALLCNVLTSRKFEYRYDLIYAGLSKTIYFKQFTIQPELGIVGKGNFGGEKIQNEFHRRKGLPELFVPYRPGGIGAFVAAIGSWETTTGFPRDGVITAASELRLLSDFVPSRISPMLSYQTGFWNQRIQFEILGGARFYLNEIEDYSQLIRSGPFLGSNLKTRVYQDLYFDLGIAFFPAQNLENDPLYMDKVHDYVPQILMVFSWNGAWYRFYNFLEY